jgi:SAM-dependent methyltransferase
MPVNANHPDPAGHPGAPGQEHHNVDGVAEQDQAAFGARWWERHYQELDPTATGRVSPYLTDCLDHAAPGTALDAGCGTGADASWLAAQGWDVTAVDVSATAIDRARVLAAGSPPDVPARITWVVADLTDWDPAQRFDLVISQYVHPDQPFDRFVQRLGDLVADGGQLLIVGHEHADALSSAGAPRDASINAATTAEVLDRDQWTVETAGTRSRDVAHEGGTVRLVDTIVRARKTPDGRVR